VICLIIAGIPAYNEEKTIAKVVLLAQNYVDKVVVCDDGSSDLTAQIAEKLGAVVIKHEKNLGYGAAIRSLFKKAEELNADILLTIDADGQHDAGELPLLVQAVLEDKADIVVGSRFLGERNHVPTYRLFGIKLLTKLTGRSVGKLTDAQSGFRAYNKKAIKSLHLSERGMGVSAEILIEAKKQGLRVAEVPIKVYYDNLDTSTHNPIKHGLSVLSTIIKLVVEERPLFYLGIPGAMFLFVGIMFGFWMFHLLLTEGRIVTNVALASIAFTLIGMFTIFTSITLYAIIRLLHKQRIEHAKS
jgi:glycosyltransferase involved in cell wall biosynthesis